MHATSMRHHGCRSDDDSPNMRMTDIPGSRHSARPSHSITGSVWVEEEEKGFTNLYG